MRQVRQQAPVLLEATKEALRYLLRQDPHPLDVDEQARQKVMACLRVAIDAAEPPIFDERDTTVCLVMTPPTWKVLSGVLKGRAPLNRDNRRLFELVHESVRETKQRVYLTLGIHHETLRQLRLVLKHCQPTGWEKPFKRMAKQVEEDGLSKNPMEIIAKMGL
jgi:hypothetical protein